MTEDIRFFLPGPSYVRHDVRHAMAAHSIGHRGPEFKQLYGEVRERLPKIFRTRNEVLVLTGSGSLAWDVAAVSTMRGSVLCLTNGAFSERFLNVCRAWGKDADQLSAPWGKAIDPEELRAALRRKRYDAVTLAHNETSTGVINPLEALAKVVHDESDAFLYVDAVSSLAGAPVEADLWGIDYLFTASQKALAVPPGLCLLTVSERLLKRAGEITHRGYYTDLLAHYKKHVDSGTNTTPAIPQIWALRRQLDVIEVEGLEARWDRHAALLARTRTWAAEKGFTYASAPDASSPTVSCLKPPAGVDPTVLVKQLRDRGFVVGGGYGDWKPSTFRIGHMGEVRLEHLDHLFTVIDAILD